MVKKNGINMALPSSDGLIKDLFTTQDERDDAKREKVLDIALASIDPFPEHPFRVTEDESLQAMAESVKLVGIQNPAIVRSKEDKRYELISGHRRKLACELAGLDTMPCIVRNMTQDEAIIAMVDSNLQREVILPSEKAKSYKMRYEAMKRQAGRPGKDNASRLGTDSRSDDELAQMSGDSRTQIHRYIRLNDLIPPILNMVDERKLAMTTAAEELSYLPADAQQTLFKLMERDKCTLSLDQAKKLRKLAEEGHLDTDTIGSVMHGDKPKPTAQFKIPKERITRFFSAKTPAKTIEDTIIKALEFFYAHQRNQGE